MREQANLCSFVFRPSADRVYSHSSCFMPTPGAMQRCVVAARRANSPDRSRIKADEVLRLSAQDTVQKFQSRSQSRFASSVVAISPLLLCNTDNLVVSSSPTFYDRATAGSKHGDRRSSLETTLLTSSGTGPLHQKQRFIKLLIRNI